MAYYVADVDLGSGEAVNSAGAFQPTHPFQITQIELLGGALTVVLDVTACTM